MRPQRFLKFSLTVLSLCLTALMMALPYITSGQSWGFIPGADTLQTEIPVEICNNLVVADVTLNDTIPLRLILDTGTGTTLITDKEIAGMLDASFDREIRLGGAGRDGHLRAYLARGMDLSMNGVRGNGLTLVVLGEDFLGLKEYLGVNVHGILGSGFFSSFVVVIDYERQVMILRKPGKFCPARGFVPCDMEIIRQKPFVDMDYLTPEGNTTRVRMMVDLGASHAVLVETDRAGSPPMPARTIEAVIGRGLSGNISGNVGRFARLDWCGFSFEDVVTSFTGEYASGMDDTTVQRNGTLGGDILSRFTLILDYKGGKIFLKKNSRYRRPFEFNLSGLDLIATEPDWRTVVVSGVIAHSPADEAGVLAGDFIISVNGVPVGSLSLGRINSLMHSKPDRKITLKISREHQVMKKTFRLRRMI